MTLTGAARLAGVMGWPVAHSLSPRLHGYWLTKYAVDGAYLPLPVRPESFADAVRGLAALGFAGANVTVPHKVAALAVVDVATPQARRIGAVNTIVIAPDGAMTGDNTDAAGFIANLTACHADWRPEAGPAVVLGAGGAARAVAVALLDAGVPSIRLINRTISRAEDLAADLGAGVDTAGWSDRAAALADAALLVNTTVLGMAGKPPLDLDLDALPRDAAVYDIVYTPLETDLLRRAAARGHPVVDGLGMLLHQAAPGFAAWFGVAPEVDDGLRTHVLAGLTGA